MIEVIVPKFKELSVENIWPMVKDVPELNKFFPDFKDKKSEIENICFKYLQQCATMNYQVWSETPRKIDFF